MGRMVMAGSGDEKPVRGTDRAESFKCAPALRNGKKEKNRS